MKTTHNEMAALRKLDGINARKVSAAVVARLAALGLCTAQGNITDAGRDAIGFRPTSFRASRRMHLRG